MLDIKQKTKSLFIHLYPILNNFKLFKNSRYHIYLSPFITWILRFILPTLVFIIIAYIGIIIGSIFSGSPNPKSLEFPTPAISKKSNNPNYISPYNDIKQDILKFTSTLPDPLYPILDFNLDINPS